MFGQHKLRDVLASIVTPGAQPVGVEVVLPEATLIRCDVKATTTSLASSDPTLNDESLNPQKDADAQQTDAAACLNPQKDADAQQTDAAACLNPQKDADAQQTDAAAFDAKMAWEKVRKQSLSSMDNLVDAVRCNPRDRSHKQAERISQWLKEVEIFSSAPTAVIRSCARTMESVSFCKDDYVYFQGDDATQFYIVVEGTILQYSDPESSSKPEKASGAKIQRTTSQTIKETRADAKVLEEKSYFGEKEVLSEGIRESSVIAASNKQCVLMQLSGNLFKEVMKGKLEAMYEKELVSVQRIPLFQDLDTKTLSSFVFCFKDHEFNPGEVITMQRRLRSNDSGRVFWIVSGIASCYLTLQVDQNDGDHQGRKSTEEHNVRLIDLMPGSCVGDTTLVQPGYVTRSAVAKTRVCAISCKIADILKKFPLETVNELTSIARQKSDYEKDQFFGKAKIAELTPNCFVSMRSNSMPKTHKTDNKCTGVHGSGPTSSKHQGRASGHLQTNEQQREALATLQSRTSFFRKPSTSNTKEWNRRGESSLATTDPQHDAGGVGSSTYALSRALLSEAGSGHHSQRTQGRPSDLSTRFAHALSGLKGHKPDESPHLSRTPPPVLPCLDEWKTEARSVALYRQRRRSEMAKLDESHINSSEQDRTANGRSSLPKPNMPLIAGGTRPSLVRVDSFPSSPASGEDFVSSRQSSRRVPPSPFPPLFHIEASPDVSPSPSMELQSSQQTDFCFSSPPESHLSPAMRTGTGNNSRRSSSMPSWAPAQHAPLKSPLGPTNHHADGLSSWSHRISALAAKAQGQSNNQRRSLDVPSCNHRPAPNYHVMSSAAASPLPTPEAQGRTIYERRSLDIHPSGFNDRALSSAAPSITVPASEAQGRPNYQRRSLDIPSRPAPIYRDSLSSAASSTVPASEAQGRPNYQRRSLDIPNWPSRPGPIYRDVLSSAAPSLSVPASEAQGRPNYQRRSLDIPSRTSRPGPNAHASHHSSAISTVPEQQAAAVGRIPGTALSRSEDYEGLFARISAGAAADRSKAALRVQFLGEANHNTQ